MKVSILIPYYGDRRRQLERSLLFLENQTYPDYEIVLIDDGAKEELPEFSDKVKYFKIRADGVPSRSSNTALRYGFKKCSGDIIIAGQPELLVPYDAVEKMITLSDMSRRNVAIQYHLTAEQIHSLPWGWEDDFERIKSVPNFWATMTPWLYTNKIAVRFIIK